MGGRSLYTTESPTSSGWSSAQPTSNLGNGRVEWRLDRTTAVKILDGLAEPTDHAGHQYVDIHTPASTLVLSYHQYTPEYFEQLPDELRYAKPGENSA
ncbi:hypothetical protein BN975_00746 [Mycolicibacterium farcinogenes]|uniref:Uncharacterized protein n=1 Tax=Mycolicibacterium senegalense TaxID=1796 RepID=A0A378T4Y0_9MYCO|nr:hypothetical protein [Mycolicibacterium senegalense]CDP82946.1 hypothetical protein BN975_00746 [Mycolicibacterium farcinogenes]STZ54965.1 Uncharacterised protein [Mycolicibacterium senegalense]